MKLKQLKDIVKECLEEDTGARNSDWKLYEDVCAKLGISKNTTLHDIVMNTKNYPSYESVSRARRFVQAKGENLATERVRIERVRNEQEFQRSFA